MPGGPSTSQTIMVSSLRDLLLRLPADSPVGAYRNAVLAENILCKDTAGGREWAFRQLRRFYALNPGSLLFRALRDLWADDPCGQPLLALLCAVARDPVLRATASLVVPVEPGDVIGPADFEEIIEAAFSGAYSDNTRRTTAQNVASSWTQSGHLLAERPTKKVRVRVHPTATAVAYALLLGHLQGERGQGLFKTQWAAVLDQPTSRLVELASAASRHGMLEFRNAGGVMEVTFHELLRPFGNDDQGALL